MNKPKLYTTGQAAEYLGVSRRTVMHHIDVTHRLKPDYNVGRDRLFFQETLDEFRRKYRAEDGLTMEEAAEYLGLSLAGLHYHVTAQKTLKPDAKRGKKLIFHQKTLDEFRRLHPAAKPPELVAAPG